MNKDSDFWAGVLLGIIGFVALANVLDKKTCWKCKKLNKKEAYVCEHCGESLR